MAIRNPDVEVTHASLDKFDLVKEQICSFFDNILKAVTERRDQLLVQLKALKQDYLNKEATRKKEIRDLEKMAKHLGELSIQENPILKLQDDHLKKTKGELKKSHEPTPVPVPHFRSGDLQLFLQKLEKIGTILEIGRIYSFRQNPVRSFGKYGWKEGEFSMPLGICLDEDNCIFICDSKNSRIQVVSIDCKFITEFGKGHLNEPHSIILNDKWVFVSDCQLNVILKFKISDYSLVGKSVSRVLSGPRGLAVDSDDEVLVADSFNNRIAVLNSELQFVREIGKRKILCPCDVKSNLDKMFVVDKSKPYNVHIFSKSADLLLYSIINLKVDADIFSEHFWDEDIFMCFDQFSNIIISHSREQSIQIFTIEGQLQHSIKCEGDPTGVTVTSDNLIVCAKSTSCSVKLY